MAAHALYKGSIAICIGGSIDGEVRKDFTRLYGMKLCSDVRTHVQKAHASQFLAKDTIATTAIHHCLFAFLLRVTSAVKLIPLPQYFNQMPVSTFGRPRPEPWQLTRALTRTTTYLSKAAHLLVHTTHCIGSA